MIEHIQPFAIAISSIIAASTPLFIYLHKHRVKQKALKQDNLSPQQRPSWGERMNSLGLSPAFTLYSMGMLLLLYLTFERHPLTTGDAAALMLCLVNILPLSLQNARA